MVLGCVRHRASGVSPAPEFVPLADPIRQRSALKGCALETSQNLFVTALRALLLAGLAALLAACASSGSLPVAPAAAAAPDYTYLIGPGDTINISVWRNPELSMTVPVRPDGQLSTPLVDELVAQGKTSAQLAREIEAVLGKYVRDPVVTVIVTNFVGPYSEQIRVVGEAAKPQFLPFKQKMTLLDVMIAVGGLTDFAAGNRATILRSSDGGKQYTVRLNDLIKRGDVSANVEMRPGDILIIPQSLF
ncbi:MAG: polysaccharide biosynthesis/export family protein [Burkholderiales bacterium]|nr:polysaccharide biosynthesis/export family protein [Burkholderiales bacterium]